MELQQLLAFSLAKQIKKPKPETFSPGEYEAKGTLTIEVDSIIKKAPQERYHPTAQIPFKEVIAVLVRRYKIKQTELDEIILEAYLKAKEEDASVKEYLGYTMQSLEKLQKTLAKLPEEKREGKTTVQGITRILNIV